MISASKITLNQNNLNILWPKAKKSLTNLRKKFCESPPCSLVLIDVASNVILLFYKITSGSKPYKKFVFKKLDQFKTFLL